MNSLTLLENLNFEKKIFIKPDMDLYNVKDTKLLIIYNKFGLLNKICN